MDNIKSKITDVALFCNIDNSTVDLLISDDKSRLLTFEKNEVICPADSVNDCLIVIISGKAVVKKHSVVMRFLLCGDVTGVSTLFCKNNVMKTDIIAQNKVTALFIERQTVVNALHDDKRLSDNYISFLSDRIQFLNGVIDRCTGTDSAVKLARHLLSISKEKGQEFSMNMSTAAAALDMGRATAYRALTQLENSGIVQKSGKNIIISNPVKLKNYIYKENLL